MEEIKTIELEIRGHPSINKRRITILSKTKTLYIPSMIDDCRIPFSFTGRMTEDGLEIWSRRK